MPRWPESGNDAGQRYNGRCCARDDTCQRNGIITTSTSHLRTITFREIERNIGILKIPLPLNGFRFDTTREKRNSYRYNWIPEDRNIMMRIFSLAFYPGDLSEAAARTKFSLATNVLQNWTFLLSLVFFFIWVCLQTWEKIFNVIHHETRLCSALFNTFFGKF